MLTENKKLCCGCASCAALCPADAIKMKEDDTGFLYPYVDDEKCVHCGLCEKLCSFRNAEEKPDEHTRVFAAKCKDADRLALSSSGGVGYALAREVISLGGSVYGAAINEDFSVSHRRATDPEGIRLFNNSKYVQSNIESVYGEVLDDLLAGRKVLFIGTACQCDAIGGWLTAKKANAGNVYLCDVLCHGVPSPGIWRDYVKLAEKAGREPLSSVTFRSKESGWHNASSGSKIVLKSGKTYGMDKYYKLFFSHLTIRQSCTACPYTRIQRPFDLTIADFWNIATALPDFPAEGGVSCVVAHTEKGYKLLHSLQDMLLCETDVSALTAKQYHQPAAVNDRQQAFWAYYQKRGLRPTMRKYVKSHYPLKAIRIRLARVFGRI